MIEVELGSQESVKIGTQVEVFFIGHNPHGIGQIKLGVRAPRHIPVDRGEIHLKKRPKRAVKRALKERRKRWSRHS